MTVITFLRHTTAIDNSCVHSKELKVGFSLPKKTNIIGQSSRFLCTVSPVPSSFPIWWLNCNTAWKTAVQKLRYNLQVITFGSCVTREMKTMTAARPYHRVATQSNQTIYSMGCWNSPPLAARDHGWIIERPWWSWLQVTRSSDRCTNTTALWLLSIHPALVLDKILDIRINRQTR